MVVPKQEKFEYNLYAKDVKKDGLLFEFVEFKQHQSKKGKNVDMMILLGSDGTKIGDFRIPIYQIKNYNDLVAKLGTDETNWKDKFFIIKPDGDVFIFELKLF